MQTNINLSTRSSIVIRGSAPGSGTRRCREGRSYYAKSPQVYADRSPEKHVLNLTLSHHPELLTLDHAPIPLPMAATRHGCGPKSIGDIVNLCRPPENNLTGNICVYHVVFERYCS